MQKTYDECYLICSTAIYFEGQVRSHDKAVFGSRLILTTDAEQRT